MNYEKYKTCASNLSRTHAYNFIYELHKQLAMCMNLRTCYRILGGGGGSSISFLIRFDRHCKVNCYRFSEEQHMKIEEFKYSGLLLTMSYTCCIVLYIIIPHTL